MLEPQNGVDAIFIGRNRCCAVLRMSLILRLITRRTRRKEHEEHEKKYKKYYFPFFLRVLRVLRGEKYWLH